MRTSVPLPSLWFAVLLPSLVFFLGCQPERRDFVERASLETNSEAGVRVTYALDADAKENLFLRVTFAPEEPGFHLFGKDISFAGIGGNVGIGGIGVPTRVTLEKNEWVSSAGSASCDQKPEQVRIEALDVTAPLYREGAVTLRLPVRIKEFGPNSYARIYISYLACKLDGVCRGPVRKKVVHLSLPKETALRPASQ